MTRVRSSALVREERAAYLRLCQRALRVASLDDCEQWFRQEVRQFLSFGLLTCAAGRLVGRTIHLDFIHGINYADPRMTGLLGPLPLDSRHVVRRWLETRKPQLIDTRTAHRRLSPDEAQEFRDYQHRNVAAHGVIEPDGRAASFFSFSQVEEPMDARTRLKLAMLAPPMHQVLCEVRASEARDAGHADRPALSARELDACECLRQGMSNEEIAASMHRSVNTVKQHLKAIYRKLGVASRTEAVAVLARAGTTPKPQNDAKRAQK